MASSKVLPIPTLVKQNENLKASWDSILEEAVGIFQKLIKFDTRNFGEDGSETEAALYLKSIFDKEGIECTEVGR